MLYGCCIPIEIANGIIKIIVSFGFLQNTGATKQIQNGEMSMIRWLNEYSGAVMAILTLVYVISTIIICIFNLITVKISRRQLKESQQQFEEENRARVIPYFDVLEGGLFCLVFKNTGHSFAEDLHIVVSDEWLSKLKNTKKCRETAVHLKWLADQTSFLQDNGKYMYPLCVPGDETNDFKLLSEVPFEVTITYNCHGKTYSESFSLPIQASKSLVNTSDYCRIELKKLKEIKAIKNELSSFANVLTQIKN